MDNPDKPSKIIDLTNGDDGQGSKRSLVWKHFEKLPKNEDGSQKAKCKFCGDLFSGSSTGGTSHLRRHLIRCRKKQNNDIRNFVLAATKENDGTMTLKNWKYDEELIRREIALMVVLDECPFSCVEGVGFRRVMAAACPQFKMMSRKTVTRDVMAIYNGETKNISELFKNIPGKIFLTSDTWKLIAEDHYVCVTAHYIDQDWKIQKRIIKFELIPPPYDGLSIGDSVLSAISKWNIESQVFSITLDNATVNDVVASNLKTHLLFKSYLPCNGAFFQVRCCCHILNLVVQAGMKLIDDIIVRLRLGVKYVKNSPLKKMNFKSIASNMNLDSRKKLRTDCPTRWNSTYLMIEFALYYKSVFLHTGMCDSNYTMKLTEDEWENVVQMYDFLKIFYEVTCAFSGNKYPTANLYFKGVWRVHYRLSEISKRPDHFMYAMVKEMQAKFRKYWSEYSLILSYAVILDPRHKVKVVEYCFSKLYGDQADTYVTSIINTLYSLFGEYMKTYGYIYEERSNVNQQPKVRDDDEFNGYDEFEAKRAKTQTEKSQLDLYLEEPSLDLNFDLDILEYWKAASMRYPELASMARDILSIPVSTVPSEVTFSTGRRVITPFRNSLKSDTVEALICLQDWMRAQNREGTPTPTEEEYYSSSSSSSDEDE